MYLDVPHSPFGMAAIALCCRCLGVRKFYIYDNNSTMPLFSSLWEYISSGIVEYSFFKGWQYGERAKQESFNGTMQYWAYNDCITR
jgi:hypothetical protein